MTILEFLKSEIIVESENDVYIDASSFDEETVEWWIEEFLYDLLDNDEKTYFEKYQFDSYKDLKDNLKDENYYLAKKIIASAIIFQHKLPTEKVYYINNSSSFHLRVPGNVIRK